MAQLPSLGIVTSKQTLLTFWSLREPNTIELSCLEKKKALFIPDLKEQSCLWYTELQPKHALCVWSFLDSSCMIKFSLQPWPTFMLLPVAQDHYCIWQVPTKMSWLSVTPSHRIGTISCIHTPFSHLSIINYIHVVMPGPPWIQGHSRTQCLGNRAYQLSQIKPMTSLALCPSQVN